MATEANVIIIPRNSFVQIQTALVNDTCNEKIQLCLPIYEPDDLSFQFFNSQRYTYFLYTLNYDSFESPFISAPHVYAYGGGILILHTGIVASDWAEIPCGKCFTIKYYWTENLDKDKNLLFETVCFERICDKCYTSKITYRCDENSFDFIYSQNISAAVKYYNSIRLPFYLSKPQYPVTRSVFTKSDGSRYKLSARMQNSWILETDYMPRDWHEKLIVALESDVVIIDNINSGLPPDSQFTQEKDYKVNWNAFLGYPTAPANGELMLTPYFNVNSNCK